MPESIRLETSSRCQLRCPSCPTTAKAIDPVVGSGVLKFDDFQNLVRANPHLRKIEISNYGEAFLNPELLDILRFAHENQVAISIVNGANLNHVSKEVLEAVVKYGVTAITCSIDGASQETYSQYRVRGNFDRVIEIIRQINAFKVQYRSKTPELYWQFIVFGHNEHEVLKAKEMARELDMEMRFKLSWDSDFSPMRDVERVLWETGLPAASREAYLDQFGTDYKNTICLQLWLQPQINWDGKNLGCCRNFWGDFGGNAFRDGLVPTLNSEKITYAREMLLGKQPPREDIPCSSCSVYQQKRATGQWMEVPAIPRPESKNPLRKVARLLSERSRRLRKSILKRWPKSRAATTTNRA
jgi:MoaA/NifB/PqqE/SkfB family radical SAM enzyme